MGWIQVDSDLANKPQVLRMARIMQTCKTHVAGCLVALWGWADIHTTDGRTGLDAETLDDILAAHGFASALCAVGWAVEDSDGGLCIVDFEKYNGATAKARAQEARKKQRQRSKKQREAPACPDSEGQNGDTCPDSEGQNGDTCPDSEGQNGDAMGNIYNTRQESENTSTVVDVQKSDSGDNWGGTNPATVEEVERFMAAQVMRPLPDEIRQCAEKYYDTRAAVGWMNRGTPIANWHHDARQYAAAWCRRTAPKKRRDGNVPGMHCAAPKKEYNQDDPF